MSDLFRDGFVYAQGLSAGPKTVVSILLVLATGLLLYLLWVPELSRLSHPPKTEAGNALPSILWDGHLGHTYTGAGANLRTEALQIGARNNLGHELRLERAYAVSGQGAGEKDLLIATSSDWQPVANARPLGDQQSFVLRLALENEIARDVFENWKNFQITIVYNGGQIERKDVTEHMVRAVYESFRPSPIGPQVRPK